MREIFGDLWDRFRKSFLVVPTNIGWRRGPKGAPGPAVMGAGVAKQASEVVPELATVYGRFCHQFGADAEVTFDLSTGLVLFPTKPLDAASPSLSWRSPSTVELVRKSAIQLAQMTYMTRNLLAQHEGAVALEDDFVFLPTVGCGAGGLPEDVVVPMLHEILDDRFILVRYRPF